MIDDQTQDLMEDFFNMVITNLLTKKRNIYIHLCK